MAQYRIRRIRLWAPLLILFFSGLISIKFLFPRDESRKFLNTPPQGWSYLRGYCAGIRWAAADIRQDRAYILAAGLTGPALDRETGLTTWSVGCLVDNGIEGMAAGYNRIIRSYVRWKGPPSYSRKQWEKILFGLNRYFDDRAKREPPQRLVADGPPVLAPDGKTKIWLKSRHNPKYERVDYLLAWEPNIECLVWPWPRNRTLEYYPGPVGSDVLLLRGGLAREKDRPTAVITQDTIVTVAFDMRHGLTLSFE